MNATHQNPLPIRTATGSNGIGVSIVNPLVILRVPVLSVPGVLGLVIINLLLS